MKIKNFKKNIVLVLSLIFVISQISACKQETKDPELVELPKGEVFTLEEDAPVKDAYTSISYKLPKEDDNENVIFYTGQDGKAYYSYQENADMSNDVKKAEIGFLEHEKDIPQTLVSSDDEDKSVFYEELNLLDNQLIYLTNFGDKYQLENLPAGGGNVEEIASLEKPASLTIIDGLIYFYDIKDDNISIKSIDPKTKEEKEIADNVHLITPYDDVSWSDKDHTAWFEDNNDEIYLVYKDNNKMKKIKMDTDAVTSLAYHGDYLTWMELPDKTSWINEKVHVFNIKENEHKVLELPEASNYINVKEKIYLCVTQTEDKNQNATVYEWDLASNEISAIHDIQNAQNISSFPKVYRDGNILINYEKDDNFIADFLSSK